MVVLGFGARTFDGLPGGGWGGVVDGLAVLSGACLTSERRTGVLALLRACDAHLPVLTAKPLTAAGFIHDSRHDESCPDCLANGRVFKSCETCGGRGMIEHRLRRDPYDTGVQAGWFGSSTFAHERAADRDRVIESLEKAIAFSERRPATDADLGAGPDEGWVLAGSRAWRDFDFGALAVGLERLRVRDWAAYSEVLAVVVYGWRPGDPVTLERALAFLCGALPDPLRWPRDVVPPAAVVPRDDEIRRLVREGAGVQWVALRFGLSVSQVYRVVKSGV